MRMRKPLYNINFLNIYFVTLLIFFSSCTTDSLELTQNNTTVEDFLTINGDTRILLNLNSDPDLRIEKLLIEIPRKNRYDLEENTFNIGVDISDPNKSLIANFGNYNIEKGYLNVRLVLPTNFSAGELVTISERIVPKKGETFVEFGIIDEISFISDSGYKIDIKESISQYVITFNEMKFENGKAILSGKITINKV